MHLDDDFVCANYHVCLNLAFNTASIYGFENKLTNEPYSIRLNVWAYFNQLQKYILVRNGGRLIPIVVI